MKKQYLFRNFAVSFPTPLAHYKFEGDTTDEIGSYDSINENSISYDPGITGQSVKFSAGGYVEIPTITEVCGSANRTFTFWTYATGSYGDGEIFFAYGERASYEKYFLRINGGIIRVEIESGGYNTNFTPPGDVWNFIAIRLNGDTLGDHTIFLNQNSEDVNGTSPINTSTGNNFRIANSDHIQTFGMQTFGGKIDEFRVFDTALTNAQIEEVRKYDA